MIGLALSGGGSRAIAFHLGCLRGLDDVGLLDRIGVLSTISGGSVIGAYYAYTPQKTFLEFESDIRRLLSRGFKSDILRKLAEPRNLVRSIRNVLVATVDAGREYASGVQPRFRGYPSRTDIFREVLEHEAFTGLKMTSPRRIDDEIVNG